MEKEEMKDVITELSRKIVKLERINEEAFETILYLNRHIRELEEMSKVRRVQILSSKK